MPASDKLYVPVSQLHVISRYSGGAPEAAPLHKLGSGAWDKAKRRAMQQVRDTAAELLNLYAQRAARKGHAFKLTYHDYEAFADGFGFEETADQAAAIEAVILDLQSGKPMDRLICGDVGFGKTEVALRAAFVAAMDGKQVAVLVPTTLLAEQHFQNFSTRFADWPMKIAELSRFRSAKEQTQALKDLAEGKLDIIIGTHKLIQKDVKFQNLGLVIIDEEHRFGVQQKEALKALRAEVDVLTLTATPIPRTLAMSLEGLRDFSVIATAPQRRLSIKTFVSNYSQGVIREAVLRELKRGGQVYFLHNEVDTIDNMQEKLDDAAARGAHPRGARPDGRARAGSGDARLLPPALQRAAVHHHHRDRHRHPHRQHHHHEPRRPLRPGAAAPAARPRRPLAPPGLCLPAGGQHGRPHRAGEETAGSDPGDGAARQRLLTSPCTTWKSAARAKCWANRRAARCRRSASASTPTCSTPPSPRCARARSRTWRTRWASPPRSTCTPRRCCPTTTAATSTSG